MKKSTILLTLFVVIFTCSLTAQVAINTDGSSANPSAMLDVKSGTSGILIPRMTRAQRLAISGPATGLMIYQNNYSEGFWYYDGDAWQKVANATNTLSIIEVLQNGVRDVTGNHYETVLVGKQIWMAENLATTQYNDGTNIPLVTDNSAWVALTTPAYCWYDNDSATNAPDYGAMYNWYTVNTGNLCPAGWHVPTDDEWKTMEMHLGMTQAQANETGFRGNKEAGKLKETGTVHWISPNIGATNESGFTALPGGGRSTGGSFNYLGHGGYYWTATEYSSSTAWQRYLFHTSRKVSRSSSEKYYGYSVRCVRD
jgi:uncharacterized protein (TIGR02145 family)